MTAANFEKYNYVSGFEDIKARANLGQWVFGQGSHVISYAVL